MKKDYSDFPGLEAIYLEDSFVLGITENSGEVIFEMEFVLLENHPRFTSPRKGESHCFAEGTLTFAKVQEIVWNRRSFNTFKDADLETDLGNIDALFELGGRFFLEGDWGEIAIVSDVPVVSFA